MFEKLQMKLTKPLTKLRNLSITLQQDSSRQNFVLRWFPNVVTFEVYYTVEKSFGKIHLLIDTINTCRTERSFNPAVIAFRKYLTKKATQYSETELRKLKERSQEFQNKIITQNQKYVTIYPLGIYNI